MRAPSILTLPAHPEKITDHITASHVWAMLRILMGWTFLWAFADKMFGLGYPTHVGWIAGGNPTYGFIRFSSGGPFVGFYTFCSTAMPVKLGLMAGLFSVGFGMMTGIGFRLAALTGIIIYTIMWTAKLPPTNNPFSDDHLMGALLMLGLLLSRAHAKWSLAGWWRERAAVKRFGFLK